MLPISSKELVRFTPESYKEQENPAVYLIQPATLKQRARFNQAMIAEGVVDAPDGEFYEAIREAIQALVEDDEQGALLQIVDEAEHRASKLEPFDAELQQKMRDIELQLAEVWPPLAKLRARRTHRLELTPIIACQMFLKGVENASFELKMSGGMLSEETLAVIPSDDLRAIGWKAWMLMYLGKDQEKNSASRSPSPDSQTASAEE